MPNSNPETKKSKCFGHAESYCNYPKIEQVGFAVENCFIDADKLANSPDSDRSSLIWVCTVCQDLAVGSMLCNRY